MKKRVAWALAMVLLGCGFAAAQEPKKPEIMHNGYWWKDKTDEFKQGFVNGYRDAVNHAATAKQLAELKGVGTKQLVDGMDAFYHDFRNVMFLVDDAMTIVLDQMRHVPDELLDSMLRGLSPVEESRLAEAGEERWLEIQLFDGWARSLPPSDQTRQGYVLRPSVG
jgi:hypothetical protein